MRIGETWGCFRELVREKFTFSEIKGLAGTAGFHLSRLAHLQQGVSGTSKGQLFDAIAGLAAEREPADQDRITKAFLVACIRRRPDLRAQFNEALGNVGWAMGVDGPYSMELLLPADTTEFPSQITELLEKAAQRFGQGDGGGAMTSIWGAVDRLTAALYVSNGLGGHGGASYQERVSKSFASMETLYKQRLLAASMESDEVKLVWNNHRQAVSQAAYVLGSFRRPFSDVHGGKEPPKYLARPALDCAIFILRSFSAVSWSLDSSRLPPRVRAMRQMS
jgi:hypothetical protein